VAVNLHALLLFYSMLPGPAFDYNRRAQQGEEGIYREIRWSQSL